MTDETLSTYLLLGHLDENRKRSCLSLKLFYVVIDTRLFRLRSLVTPYLHDWNL